MYGGFRSRVIEFRVDADMQLQLYDLVMSFPLYPILLLPLTISKMNLFANSSLPTSSFQIPLPTRSHDTSHKKVKSVVPLDILKRYIDDLRSILAFTVEYDASSYF